MPVERCIVTVLVELLLTEEVLERPVMWNGKEYWKIVVSESRVIWKPNVAKLWRLVGTAHVYVPREFSTPARQASVEEQCSCGLSLLTLDDSSLRKGAGCSTLEELDGDCSSIAR